MAQQSFDVAADNAETRITHFLESISRSSASINAIERDLTVEKNRLRKFQNDRRKLKFRLKEILEKLKATEISIDNSTTKIRVLEKAHEDCDNDAMDLR